MPISGEGDITRLTQDDNNLATLIKTRGIPIPMPKNRRLRTRASAVVVTATALATLVAACGSGSSGQSGGGGSKSPILIGAPFALSGDEASIGQAGLGSAKQYVARINSQGGIDGRKLQLVPLDTKTDLTTGILAIKKLISQHVTAMIGVSDTGLAMQMLPLVNQAKIPVLADVGGGSFNNPAPKYFFKIPENDSVAAKVELTYMKSQGITKLAWLGINQSYGQSGYKAFEAASKEIGVSLLNDTFYPGDSQNLTPQLTKVQGLGADALLLYGIPPSASIAQQEIATMKFPIPVYQSYGVATSDFIKATGAAADGVQLVGGKLQVYKQLPASDPQLPALKDFAALSGGSQNRFAGDTYDCLNLLTKAIKAVGPDSQKIQHYLEGVHDYAGVTGIISFSPQMHAGVSAQSLAILKIQGGAFQLVKTGGQVLGK